MKPGIRIIAGNWGGRVIHTFKDDLSVRPLLGRIKKSLFDILYPRLKLGPSFLDLYAGTGNVGIEALSRGARRALFIDGDDKCVQLIKKNLQELGWEDRDAVRRGDITAGLKWLGEKFDIIYMGPPYKDKEKRPLALTGTTLKVVVESDIMNPGAWIISQRHIKEPVAAPPELENFREEKYGDTLVGFYRRRPEVNGPESEKV
jgi:16S rRNA (guanine(966)-N(2))-methyltransferase RsmD